MRHAITACMVWFGFAGNVNAGTWYVDPNAAYDGNGSADEPYRTINSAISNPSTQIWDTILVRCGVLYEDVTISKSVSIHGAGPDCCRVVGGGNAFRVNDNQGVYIQGMYIQSSAGPGIYIGVSAYCHVKNCIVSSCNGHGVDLFNRGGTLRAENCTIADNARSGIYTNGAVSSPRAPVSLTNCIVAFNGNAGDWGIDGYRATTELSHNDFFGNGDGSQNYGSVGDPGPGSISQDPLFVDRSTGNFHLRRGGPTSPCINAGKVGMDFVDPDGTRNDMGAYGGPGSAGFFPDPNGGPIVTNLQVWPPVVPQGDTFSITATGEVR